MPLAFFEAWRMLPFEKLFMTARQILSDIHALEEELSL